MVEIPEFPEIAQICPGEFPEIPGISGNPSRGISGFLTVYKRLQPESAQKPPNFPPKIRGKFPGNFAFCKETVFFVFGIFGNFTNFEQKSYRFTNNFSSILSAKPRKTRGKFPPKKFRKKSACVVLEKKPSRNFYTFFIMLYKSLQSENYKKT